MGDVVIITMIEFPSQVPGLGWEQWVTHRRLKVGSGTCLGSSGVQSAV